MKNVHRMKKEDKELITMAIDHSTREEKLLQIIQKHDGQETEAYEELYHRYAKLIRYIAMQSLSNEADAEDVVQETFIEIQRSMDSLRNPKYFRLWVYRIVHSKCSNIFRKKKFSYVDVDGEYIQTMIPDNRIENIPQKQMRFHSDQEMMRMFLSELPAGQSIVLQMYYMEQFSIKEIAGALDLPEGTVKSRMSVGKKTLKEKVEAYEKSNNIKISFHTISEGLFLTYGGMGVVFSVPTIKSTQLHVSNISGVLTSKIAVVTLCGACIVGGGSAIYQTYQNQRSQKENVMPASIQKPVNNFRKVIVEDREITTAKGAYFYLLENACCEEEIKAMSKEDIEKLKPVYTAIEELQGYHYELLNTSGWISAFKEKIK